MTDHLGALVLLAIVAYCALRITERCWDIWTTHRDTFDAELTDYAEFKPGHGRDHIAGLLARNEAEEWDA